MYKSFFRGRYEFLKYFFPSIMLLFTDMDYTHAQGDNSQLCLLQSLFAQNHMSRDFSKPCLSQSVLCYFKSTLWQNYQRYKHSVCCVWKVNQSCTRHIKQNDSTFNSFPTTSVWTSIPCRDKPGFKNPLTYEKLWCLLVLIGALM